MWTLLNDEERALIRKEPVKYTNISQRLDNTRLKTTCYRGGGEWVIESNGYIVPTFERPDQFERNLDEILPVERFGNQMSFAALPVDQFKIIASRYKVAWEEHCYLLYYEGSPFDDLKMSYHLSGEDYTVDMLKLSDAALVFEHYVFKDDGIGYIEDIIENEITLCLRCDGEPVSWVVQREDGSLGIMFTTKEHRRLGLGQILSRHLINKVLKKGQIPYLHIHTDNDASLALAGTLGFKWHSEVVWFGVER